MLAAAHKSGASLYEEPAGGGAYAAHGQEPAAGDGGRRLSESACQRVSHRRSTLSGSAYRGCPRFIPWQVPPIPPRVVWSILPVFNALETGFYRKYFVLEEPGSQIAENGELVRARAGDRAGNGDVVLGCGLGTVHNS